MYLQIHVSPIHVRMEVPVLARLAVPRYSHVPVHPHGRELAVLNLSVCILLNINFIINGKLL